MEIEITEFLQAVGEKDIQLVENMISNGHSPSKCGKYGNTPLCNAVQSGSIEIIEVLLSHGADINEKITYKSPVDGRVKEKYTPLMFAFNLSVMEYLIKNGAEINYQAPNGYTMLMLCASVPSEKYFKLVKLLLSLGANKSIETNNYKGKKGSFTAYNIAVEEEMFLNALNKEHPSEKLNLAIEKINQIKVALQ